MLTIKVGRLRAMLRRRLEELCNVSINKGLPGLEVVAFWETCKTSIIFEKKVSKASVAENRARRLPRGVGAATVRVTCMEYDVLTLCHTVFVTGDTDYNGMWSSQHVIAATVL